jgi:hypothetical protein
MMADATSANCGCSIKSKVVLQGEGAATILKVRANNGDYTQIMSGTTPSTRLEDVVVRHLRIDQNVENVTNTDITRDANNQYAILSSNFKNVRVENVHFDQCSGVNTVAFNDYDGERAEILQCYFNFVMGTSVTGDYDNSAIYMHCFNHLVLGNVLVAQEASFGKARGAIETHGGPSIVSNNHSFGYQTGVNVVSESSGNPERLANGLNVVGNSVESCNAGIQLYAATGYTLRDVNISGNVMSVAQVDYDRETCTGIATAFSTKDMDQRGTCDGVRIANNRIYFQDESSSGRSQTAKGVSLTNSNSYGIGLQYYGPVNNVTIVDNHIQNAPLKGVHIGNAYYPTRNVRVDRNTFVDCGTNVKVLDEKGSPHPYRAVVFLDYELHDIEVGNNRIVFTDEAPKGMNIFYAHPTAGSKRINLRQNEIYAEQGSYRNDVDYSYVKDEMEQTGLGY